MGGIDGGQLVNDMIEKATNVCLRHGVLILWIHAFRHCRYFGQTIVWPNIDNYHGVLGHRLWLVSIEARSWSHCMLQGNKLVKSSELLRLQGRIYFDLMHWPQTSVLAFISQTGQIQSKTHPCLAYSIHLSHRHLWYVQEDEEVTPNRESQAHWCI